MREQHAPASERQLIDRADGDVVRIILRRQELRRRGISRIEEGVGRQELGPGVGSGDQVAVAEALFEFHVQRVVPALAIVGVVGNPGKLRERSNQGRP